jgi:hypothetical protein
MHHFMMLPEMARGNGVRAADWFGLSKIKPNLCKSRVAAGKGSSDFGTQINTTLFNL